MAGIFAFYCEPLSLLLIIQAVFHHLGHLLKKRDSVLAVLEYRHAAYPQLNIVNHIGQNRETINQVLNRLEALPSRLLYALAKVS